MHTVPERCRSCPMWIDATYINGSPLYETPLCMACRQAVDVIKCNPYWLAAHIEEVKEAEKLRKLRPGEDYFA